MNELIEYLEEYLETNSYNEHAALLTRTNLEMIVDSLKKTDKYRWHDLRKNPEDLPENEQEVEICAEQTVEIGGNKRTWKTYTHGIHEDGTVHTENSSWVWDEIDCYGQYCEETDDWIIPEGWWEQSHYTETNNWVIYDKVIAWRYIEPFESEPEPECGAKMDGKDWSDGN